MAPKVTVRRKPSKNGRVLTVKQLPEKDYQTVHKAPHGCRQDILKNLLSALTTFALNEGIGWHADIIAKRVKIVRTK